MKTLPSVTVAVSAFNEDKNIVNFLKSVLMQKEEGYLLKQIWVHSDGSRDKTVKLARSLRSKKIKIWDHKVRVGKSTWLNRIYKDLNTDFLVQSDADVVFAHPLVIHDLIQPLIKNKKVGMVGGNPMPVDEGSFWERVVSASVQPYQDFRSSVRKGKNPYSAIGQLLAYRKELVKDINIPVDMVTNDVFTYFDCLIKGWEYRFVKSAVVLYRGPQRRIDFIRQYTRFQVGYNRMFDYFPSELVISELYIPKILKIKALLKQLIKYPIYSCTFYVFNLYCQISALFNKNRLNAKWPMALTTKKLTI